MCNLKIKLHSSKMASSPANLITYINDDMTVSGKLNYQNSNTE